MADALSLAASIIAVVGTAEGIAKTIEKVRSIYNAPDELLALINEVSDLQIVLGDIHIHFQSSQGLQVSQEHLQHLSIFVDRARERLLRLDELIQYNILKPQSSPDHIKLSKMEWIKATKKIERFRQSLRDTRLNLVAHMVMINSTGQSRIGLTIDEIHIVSNQLQASQQSFHDNTHLQLNEQTRLLNNLLLSQANIQGLLQLQNSLNESTRPPAIEASPFANTRISSCLVHIQAHTSSNQRFLCTSQCRCACHQTRAFKSPSILHHALGTLFVGYSGHPISAFRRCTEKSCASQSAYKTHVRYIFPPWFISQAITAVVMGSFVGEIKVSLTVRRTVPADADIFRLAQLDDIESLKALLKSGLASPNDIDMFGITVLCVLSAKYLAQIWRTCDLLLKAGADPYLGSREGGSAYASAWSLILEGSRDPTISKTLRNLFPGDVIEERGFSKLHKAVLQLEHCNLEYYLKIYGSLINDQDNNGDTALMWAARRADRDTVEILIKAGADVNLQSNTGKSALHQAVLSSDLKSIQLILNAGANPCQADLNGFSPLHVIRANTPREVIEYLVDAGVDLHLVNYYGAPPLHQSALCNNVVTAKALLDNGADINLTDYDGDSALTQSILSNADDVMQLLLSHEATYTSGFGSSHSILHFAALSGGLRTLDILYNAKLQDVDPDALNRQGQTPLQIAHARVTKPEGFVERLQKLLMDIRARNAELRRANANRNEVPATNHQGSHFVKKLKSIKAKIQARFPLSKLRYTIKPIPWDTRRKMIRTFLLLAMTYLVLLYFKALGLGRALQGLGHVWSMLGPGDFMEL